MVTQRCVVLLRQKDEEKEKKKDFATINNISASLGRTGIDPSQLISVPIKTIFSFRQSWKYASFFLFFPPF